MNKINIKKNMLYKIYMMIILTCMLLGIQGCTSVETVGENEQSRETVISVTNVPEYSGEAYIQINNNKPQFDENEITEFSFEEYGELDSMGRCTVAYANIGVDLMPTEKRGEIGHVKPTGWQSAKYDIVDGRYLYNRCHLIGFQLTAENANRNNLITGTRYMNVEGMLPFENKVADYVRETKNHVLYRVKPVFEGNNLVASGVQMEALSVEDDGAGIQFNVYVYNVQPGVDIDYSTGDSVLGEQNVQQSDEITFVINTKSKKFHYPDCASVSDMKKSNKEEYTGSYDDLINQGYLPCGKCINKN